MKNSDARPENVVSLTGAKVDNDRRSRFVQCVAQSFDKYVADNGYEPEAIVYVLCGLKQSSRIAWDIHEGSAGGATSIIALAAVHMMAEAQENYESLPG